MNNQKEFTTMEPVTLTPVGIVRSEIKEPMLRADEEGLSLEERNQRVTEMRIKLKTLVSELVIDPDLDGVLDGIEAFSHILVLYWPHLVPEERRKTLRRVHPMGRKNIPQQGVFATCSPARPNPILVTAVKLLGKNGNVLQVQGFEAVDGSPILDIKAYNPGYYRVENPKVADWMEALQRELDEPD